MGNSFGSEEITGLGNSVESDASTNQWESRFGMRIDLLAAFAYLLGPISGACQVADSFSQIAH